MNFSSFKERIKENKYLIFLLAIIISSFIYQFMIFTLYPYSYGVDGAYYDLQVKNILETGEMWAGDNPFVFYYFAFLTIIMSTFMPFMPISVIITLSIKIGIVIFCSLIPIPVYLLIKKYSKSEAAALFGAFLSTFNPLLFRMMGDFVKNAIGTFFLLCFVYVFLICCENKYELKRTITLYVVNFLLLILLIFTHIYPTGFAVCFVLIYLIYSVSHSLINERKLPFNEIKIISFLIISGGLTIISIYFFLPDFFQHFLKIESFIEDLFGITLQDSSGLVRILQLPPPNQPKDPLIPLISMGLLIVGGVIIVYDLIKKRTTHPAVQYIAFNMILFLPVYMIIPNVNQLPSPFMSPSNIYMDFLCFLTTFPVTAGISLIVFEIYKNDPDRFNINRTKGILLSIFLLSMILALPFISLEWRERFAYMNFIPISLLAGYCLKALKDVKNKNIFMFMIIVFFSISFTVQTQYFNTFQSRPIITDAGVQDLLYLKNYVENNNTLNGSICITNDLGMYYHTALITDLTTVLSMSHEINASYYADFYQETIFIIQVKMGPPPMKPGYEMIRDVPDGQFYIILANYTYH
ncbi:MAG: hypothetical protein ACTSVY_12690 [Candidatus Helarchaeota archaeon]